MNDGARLTGRPQRLRPPAARAAAAIVGGVPTLPKGSPQSFGVSSSQFGTAQRACQHLLLAWGSQHPSRTGKGG
jgi:hypothetical protein